MKIKKNILKKANFFFHQYPFLWGNSLISKLYFSHLITKKIIEFIQNKEVHNVCLYLAEQDQIETLGIMKWCLNNQKNVFVYNFNTARQIFLAYPLTKLDYQIYYDQSYKNIKINNLKPIKNPNFDLVLIPVYFAHNKTAFYYQLKNYQKISRFNYKFLIGIGYENVWDNHSFYNQILINKYSTYIECDEVYFANKLVKNKKL